MASTWCRAAQAATLTHALPLAHVHTDTHCHLHAHTDTQCRLHMHTQTHSAACTRAQTHAVPLARAHTDTLSLARTHTDTHSLPLARARACTHTHIHTHTGRGKVVLALRSVLPFGMPELGSLDAPGSGQAQAVVWTGTWDGACPDSEGACGCRLPSLGSVRAAGLLGSQWCWPRSGPL